MSALRPEYLCARAVSCHRKAGIFGRERRARYLAIVATVVLLVGLATPVQASDVDPLALASAMRFREAFGLTTDPETVRTIEISQTTDRRYSVALLPDEVKEMDLRMEIQEKIPPLLEYGRARADTFGGLWVDQSNGGVIHLGFTNDVAAHRHALDKLTPDDAVLIVDEVAWIESQLRDLTDRISRGTDFDASIGVTVHNTVMKTSSNSVDVFIEPYSQSAAAAIREQYGPAVIARPGVSPEVTACYNRDNCPGPPIMSGIYNDWGCTVGFGIWMDGKRRFLTAGHCVYDVVKLYGWSGWIWMHQSTSLGYSTDHSWFDYSGADAGSMGNVSSSIHSNRVMLSTTNFYEIHGSQGGGNQDWEGMAVCQSGQTSGFRCGQITSVNTTPYYSKYGVHMKWQRQASYLVQGGDSGAPVISSSNRSLAVGLQSGRDSLYVAYYSHISAVLATNGPNGGIGAAIWTYDS